LVRQNQKCYGLFKWSDFALDLYFEKTDEVFSLLNITTVNGKRVEIPPSLQPKTANALIQRVVRRGAELSGPIPVESGLRSGNARRPMRPPEIGRSRTGKAAKFA